MDDFQLLIGYSVGNMPLVKHFRDLDVYKGAMSLVTEIFASSKKFPLDERFTSKMASAAIAQSGMKKMDRQNKALVDTISATIILQSYLYR